MELPREYNAAVDLVERNLAAGRGGKVAYIDDSGTTSFAQLAERVDRAANALRGLGIKREQRIAIAMLDSADWVALFLGAIKAGVVPVALNTLLTPADYEYQLNDSRARALFMSSALQKAFEGMQARCQSLKCIVNDAQLKDLLATANLKAEAAATLVLDGLKGAAPVLAARVLGAGEAWVAAAGLSAVLGHCFPLFLRFRGGKGVATASGVFFALTPLATFACLAGFLLLLATTINYVDRQVVSLLGPTLSQQFGWSDLDYSYIVFNFTLAYAIGLLVSGRVIDWLGTKTGYAVALVFWSFAAIAHAFSHKYAGPALPSIAIDARTGFAVVTLVGSVAGSSIFLALGISPGAGIVAVAVVAFVGAALLIVLQRKIWPAIA